MPGNLPVRRMDGGQRAVTDNPLTITMDIDHTVVTNCSAVELPEYTLYLESVGCGDIIVGQEHFITRVLPATNTPCTSMKAKWSISKLSIPIPASSTNGSWTTCLYR
jgi:hypothetical protein